MINFLDHPIVREQIERDTAAAQVAEHVRADTPAEVGPTGALPEAPGSTYPARRLVLENGSYRVAGHDE